jgi:hypothetical protein
MLSSTTFVLEIAGIEPAKSKDALKIPKKNCPALKPVCGADFSVVFKSTVSGTALAVLLMKKLALVNTIDVNKTLLRNNFRVRENVMFILNPLFELKLNFIN